MPFTGPGGAVPPGLRIPGKVGGTRKLPDEVIEDIDCIACGSIIQIVEIKATILSVCQRPSNPCIVEINFELEGDGEDTYDIDEDLSVFSIDSTNGQNGTWYKLVPLVSDPVYTGPRYEVRGKVTGVFVADMCNHVSSFMNEPKVSFYLVFKKVSGFFGPGGGVTPGLR